MDIKMHIMRTVFIASLATIAIQFVLWLGTVAIIVGAHEGVSNCPVCEECPIQKEERRSRDGEDIPRSGATLSV